MPSWRYRTVFCGTVLRKVPRGVLDVCVAIIYSTMIREDKVVVAQSGGIMIGLVRGFTWCMVPWWEKHGTGSDYTDYGTMPREVGRLWWVYTIVASWRGKLKATTQAVSNTLWPYGLCRSGTVVDWASHSVPTTSAGGLTRGWSHHSVYLIRPEWKSRQLVEPLWLTVRARASPAERPRATLSPWISIDSRRMSTAVLPGDVMNSEIYSIWI